MFRIVWNKSSANETTNGVSEGFSFRGKNPREEEKECVFRIHRSGTQGELHEEAVEAVLDSVSLVRVLAADEPHSLARVRHKRPRNALLLAPAGHRCLLRTLPGARIGLRTLTPGRKSLPMPQAPVAADIHKALDMHRHIAAEVAFDGVVRVDVLAGMGVAVRVDVCVGSGVTVALREGISVGAAGCGVA